MAQQTCRRCGQVHDQYTGCTVARITGGRATVVGEDEALVGNIVGERYQVGDVIGQGATGTVFNVQHVSFARPAAMKVLRPRYADDDLISRVFHGEARAAWSVSHPGLCEVFDIGSLPDGSPFFVMEHLEGETLAARIARERLSLGSAVDVVMQMLSAIASIHARDLLLRDLRPQNIYLAHRRGCRPLLKILDFGLARLTPLDRVQEEWDTLRATVGSKDAVGSTAIPYYLSPERTRGENGIEPASDLFVAAVILYEALAGERPFISSSFNGVLLQICQGKPPPLHELRSDVSVELSNFIARALSPNPRARPTTAKEMQDELRSIFETRKGAGSTSMYAAANAVVPHNTTVPPGAPEQGESTFATMAPTQTPILSPAHAPPSLLEKAKVAATTPAPEPLEPSPSVTSEREVTRPRPMFVEEDPYETQQTKRDELLATATAPISGHTQPLGVELPHVHPHVHPHGVPIALAPLVEEDIATRVGQRHVDAPIAPPDHDLLDEASADNIADRTVPPPADASIDVEVSFDDSADKTMDRRRALALAVAELPRDEEEETETMKMTPELRARVDQLMANKPALPLPIPPPRVKPPRR